MSHVWFSDYSVCYIELGALSAGPVLRNGLIGNPTGEVTVFLGYDWLAKAGGPQRSRLELHTKLDEREKLAAKMVGQTIESIGVVEPDLQIEIGLSAGMTLTSVSSDDENPNWDVRFNKYREGILRIEDRKVQFRRGSR